MNWSAASPGDEELTIEVVGEVEPGDEEREQFAAARRAVEELRKVFPDGALRVSISGRANPERHPGVADPTGLREVGPEHITVQVSSVQVDVDTLPPLESAELLVVEIDEAARGERPRDVADAG